MAEKIGKVEYNWLLLECFSLYKSVRKHNTAAGHHTALTMKTWHKK
jgi:hypothetical protein